MVERKLTQVASPNDVEVSRQLEQSVKKDKSKKSKDEGKRCKRSKDWFVEYFTVTDTPRFGAAQASDEYIVQVQVQLKAARE